MKVVPRFQPPDRDQCIVAFGREICAPVKVPVVRHGTLPLLPK